MASYSMDVAGSLVSRARTILDAATSLQQQLDSASLPQPSFLSGGRRDWFDASHLPELLETRLKLLDAAQSMFDLVMGPFDTHLYHMSIMKTKLDILRALNELKIAEHVPLEGDVEVSQLAHNLDLDAGVLNRYLKCGYLAGIFRETREGYVAHTNFSAVMPEMTNQIDMGTSPLVRKGMFYLAQAARQDSSQGKKLCPLELADKEQGGRGFWRQLAEDYPNGEGKAKFFSGLKVLGQQDFGRDFIGFSQGFDWAKLGPGVVVDVGGGTGDIALSVAKSYPDREFVVQDLESSKGPATGKIRQQGLDDRVKFQTQDFFQMQPSNLKPSAYLLVRIFHDWKDEDCLRIIKTLLPAMEEHGTRILVAERILSDNDEKVPAYKEWAGRLSDISMFAFFGAKERSRKEWEKLLKKADERLRIETFKRPASTACAFMQVGFSTAQGGSANGSS